MNMPSAAFEAHFSSESMRAAGVAFRDYQFKQYGFLLIVACAVNSIGLAFAVGLGAEPGPALYLIAFMVALGPIWLLYKYYFGPHLQSLRLQRVLPARGTVSVDSDFVFLPVVNGSELSLPWSRTKVLEQASLYLLVASPLFTYYVPKAGMPATVEQVFQAKSAPSAA